jgi:hypothetical protein
MWRHVDLVWTDVSEECIVSSPCELLLLESGSWGMGIVWEPRVRGSSAIGGCLSDIFGKEMSFEQFSWARVPGTLAFCAVSRQYKFYAC